jgi:hypothetical protein
MALILERTATMIIGETLFAEGESATYYTPWFPRGGDNAVFAFDIIARSNVSTLTVTAQTKNSEDTDSGGSVVSATAATLSDMGVNKWTAAGWTGCLELVRFKITLTASENQVGLVHLRPLAPTWVTN